MSDPKAWRSLLVAVKVEDEYGVAPADMTDATILEVVTREAGGYYEGNTVERERVREGFGNFEQVNTGPHATRQIRVPYSTSGTKGEPPAYGPLLRACFMAETIDETEGEEKVIYDTVSRDGESVTLLWWAGGKLQRMRGVRGTWERTSDAQGLPSLQFNLTGLYERPTEEPAVSGVETPLLPELPVNKQNSTFEMFGFAARMQSYSFTLGNDVVYRNLVGYEGVHITDRRASGQVSIEAPDLNEFQVFEKVESHNGHTEGVVRFIHGTEDGRIIEHVSSRVQLSAPTESETDGIVHYGIDLRMLPDGNDDGDTQLIYR